MLIRSLWKSIILNVWRPSFGDYLFAILVTPIALLLDLLLLPVELVAFILHRLIEGEWNDEQ